MTKKSVYPFLTIRLCRYWNFNGICSYKKSGELREVQNSQVRKQKYLRENGLNIRTHASLKFEQDHKVEDEYFLRWCNTMYFVWTERHGSNRLDSNSWLLWHTGNVEHVDSTGAWIGQTVRKVWIPVTSSTWKCHLIDYCYSFYECVSYLYIAFSDIILTGANYPHSKCWLGGGYQVHRQLGVLYARSPLRHTKESLTIVLKQHMVIK